MKLLPKLSKKLIALITVTSTMFVLLSGTVFAANVDKTLAKADGNAYFYVALSGLNVEAPDNFKVGFTANGSDPYYITSNIIAHTERLDKNHLIPNAVNTFTIYTGDKNGLIDETLSRSEAGTGCEEFSVTKNTLNLTLPNGLIILPSKLTAYKPKDNTTPLKDGYIASDVTSNVSMGDNSLEQAYKFEVEYDLTDVDWNPANDIDPILPDIKNVSLQIGAEPSSRNIVWYSTSEEAGIVQLALKADMTGTDFPTNAKSFSTTSHSTGLTGYTSYKATITDLVENTEYVYRVGNDVDGWSSAYSFKTQGFSGAFSFLAVSDPQLGQGSRFDNIQDEIDGWTDTLDKAKAAFPDAAFLTCMGDQVAKTYSDSQFDAFFDPESLKSFAVAAVVGNHDVGSNYAPHFNMPNLSGYGVQTTMGPGSDDYWFTYGDALFMHINGISPAYDEHVKFMEETIEANPNAKWKFVMIHYGFYGATNQSYVTEVIINIRKALAPEFSRLGIDVVLDGHEHCYSRSYLVNGFTETPNLSTGGSSVTDPDANEVLYLTFNSASGTDYVKPLEMEDLPRTAKVHQEYIPSVSNIDMTDSSFTINTYRTSDMEVIDTFTINRTDAPGVKTVLAYPKTSTVKTGMTQTFTAKIFGYNNPSQDVIWSVSGNESSKTTIDSNGMLSIDIDETAKSLEVTATSAANSSKSASVTVDVESNISEINVAQGVTYLLPTTVNGSTVTQWTNQNGDNVTLADTSLVGYRFYIATLSDGTALKFRVNVGEYKTLMSDDFEAYNESQYETAISKQALTGGTFTKPTHSDSTNGTAKLAKDGTNTVAAFGPHTSAFANFQWAPTDVALKEAFNVSYKLKVNTLDLDDVTKSEWVYFFTNNFGGSGCVQLRTYVTVSNGTKTIGDTELYCTGSPYKKGVISNIEWTEPDANNVVSMKEYIQIEINGNDVQYSASANGTEIANSVPWNTTSVNEAGVSYIRWAKRNSDNITTLLYADDMVYSKAVYVTDTVKFVPATATIEQGASAAQTATVALDMSDGTTKNFTVNYTADTTTAGVKTANGTIEGFDDVVPVTYTVNQAAIPAVIDKIEINEDVITQVILNNNIALEDGTKLLVAVYDSEPRIMRDVCFVDLSETQRATGEQTITLPDTDTLLAASGSVVKAFVWSSELEPLSSVLESTR